MIQKTITKGRTKKVEREKETKNCLRHPTGPQSAKKKPPRRLDATRQRCRAGGRAGDKDGDGTAGGHRCAACAVSAVGATCRASLAERHIGSASCRGGRGASEGADGHALGGVRARRETVGRSPRRRRWRRSLRDGSGRRRLVALLATRGAPHAFRLNGRCCGRAAHPVATGCRGPAAPPPPTSDPRSPLPPQPKLEPQTVQPGAVIGAGSCNRSREL